MRSIPSSSAKLQTGNWEGPSVAGHSTPTHRNVTRKATKNISHCLSQSVFFCFSRLFWLPSTRRKCLISSTFAILRNIFLCGISFCVTRSNVYLDGKTLTVSEGFTKGKIGLNGSLWVGGVDERTTIPKAFPIINAFQGGIDLIDLNGGYVVGA